MELGNSDMGLIKELDKEKPFLKGEEVVFTSESLLQIKQSIVVVWRKANQVAVTVSKD